MKIKNMLNAHQFPYKGQVNNQKSLTLPDQTLSIKQILEKFTSGLPMEAFEPHYDDDNVSFDDYLPDPKRMDFAEIHELKQQTRDEISFLNGLVEQEKAKNLASEKVGLTKTENEG